MSKRAAEDIAEAGGKRGSRTKKTVSYNEDALADAVAEPKEAPAGSSVAKKNKPLAVIAIHPAKQPLPTRNTDGDLIFADHPEFRPNLTPKEVLQLGSFGGTYFRPIKSGVTGESYKDVWKELPQDWLEGLDVKKQVESPDYRVEVNKYKAKCGGSLDMWESSGWITHVDPYGWFQVRTRVENAGATNPS
jgi:hypothetical protein